MSFTMTLTTAGRDALVDAQNGGTAAIQIAEVGLSSTAVSIAPTLTSIPDELKRINGVSGITISETVIHLTALDASQDQYDVRTFAIYLADGTLFAVHSQADPIVSKAPPLQLQLAFDIAFQDTITGDITFGDATFLFPPATETLKGVAEIATQGEVDGGTDDARFITPLKLANRLADAFGAIVSATETAEGVAEIATQAEADAGAADNKIVTPLKLAGVLAPIIQDIVDEAAARAAAIAGLQADINAEENARQSGDSSLESDISNLERETVTGSGLASGGGQIRFSPTIDVDAASASQVRAGTADDVAITPGSLGPFTKSLSSSGYCTVPTADPANTLLIQWGRFTASSNGSTSVSFPISFSQAFSVVTDGTSDSSTNAQDNYPAIKPFSINSNGFQVHSANDSSDAMAYIAIGRINLS